VKIALCISGFFNSKRDKSSLGANGFKHIEKHILSKGDVDVYVHSWDVENSDKIKELYCSRLQGIEIEPNKDFKKVFNQNGLDKLPVHRGATPFWNVFSQFYSVQRSFELLKESNKKYDVVIKARFDLGQINRNNSGARRQPVQCINFQPDLDMTKIHMADWSYLESEGPADMWFYSGQENMEQFCNIYDIVSKDIKINSEYEKWAGTQNGGIVNTIKAWKWFMIKTKLWDKKSLLKTTWE
jgi:hypothetical protein